MNTKMKKMIIVEVSNVFSPMEKVGERKEFMDRLHCDWYVRD